MTSPVAERVATPRILVVGNEVAVPKSVIARLSSALMDRAQWVARREAVEKVRNTPNLNLLFLEIDKGDGETLQTLSQLRALRPALPIVVLANRGPNGCEADAIRAGADGFLNMPFEDSELEPLLRRHLSSKQCVVSWSSDIAEPMGNGQLFVCASPPMRKLREEARVLASIDGPVLILGESGTGKETIARLIHHMSPRAEASLVKVNCVTLAGELLESELFGQQREGVRFRTGKLALCHKGVVVLEGIGEMSVTAQAKLLRLLQDSQILPVGSEDSVEVDVRVLALGNLDLPYAVKERRFREDLYYWLSAFTVVVPPLRERNEDIPLLLEYFMERLAAQYQRSVLPFSPATVDACRHYTWPGNLRELENFVKRYLIMGDEDVALRGLNEIALSHGIATPGAAPARNGSDTTSLRSLVRNVRDEAEKNAIAAALASTRWNRKAAAELLKISYRNLLYKIAEYHMTPPTRGRRTAPTPGTKN